jgi:hypothetical protein
MKISKVLAFRPKRLALIAGLGGTGIAIYQGYLEHLQPGLSPAFLLLRLTLYGLLFHQWRRWKAAQIALESHTPAARNTARRIEIVGALLIATIELSIHSLNPPGE